MSHLAHELIRLARRWRRDTRGSSMITAAITLPLLIILMMGVWYLFLFLTVKQSLHLGVHDAARYLSEEGRYWNIDPHLKAIPEPDPITGIELYPVDFWDMQAKRIVANRLRDFLLPEGLITESLFVTVTEPLLLLSPEATAQPLEEGYFEQLCDQESRFEGEFRHWENIRFEVYGTYKVPLWSAMIPWYGQIKVVLHDRAVGYVQCPRWQGTGEAGNPDKSIVIGREAPYIGFRRPLTPPPLPTVTLFPTPEPVTPTVTATSGPTVTPGDTPTGTAPAPTNTSPAPPAP